MIIQFKRKTQGADIKTTENKCWFLFILLLLLGSTSFISGDQGDLIRTELIIENKDETYFKSIADLEVYKDFLFILDNDYARVLQFIIDNNKLKFIRSYGRFGQGPGDIERPMEISIWNDILSVKDQLGISFFDLNGSFMKRFRLFSPMLSFLFRDNRIYYATSNPQKNDLIEVYSTEGKRLFTFAEKENFFKINYNIHKGMRPVTTELTIFDCILLSDEEFIYCMNRRFGTITKFTISGEKISATNIIPQLGKNEQSKANENTTLFLKKGYDLSAAKGEIPEYYIFRDAKIINNYIYILVDSHNILSKRLTSIVEIKKIDKQNLKVVSTHKSVLPDDEKLFIFHLAVKIDNKDPSYFVEVLADEGFKIYKFQPINIVGKH